jgi:hypothetical protein
MAEQPIAEVHLWSKGGYISVSEDPMTHIGFEIHNTSAWPIMFDANALELTLFDGIAAPLPKAQSVSLEPISRAQRPIRPGETTILGAYIVIGVRPRAVSTMQVQWALRAGDQRYVQVTRFARDDDYPVVPPDPVVPADPVVPPDSVETQRVTP